MREGERLIHERVIAETLGRSVAWVRLTARTTETSHSMVGRTVYIFASDWPEWRLRASETPHGERGAVGWVYFIEPAGGGPVKIGYTSGSPRRRFLAIQMNSPVPLRLIAVSRGTLQTEKDLHFYFRDGRLHGEWFDETTPGLLEHIESVQRGHHTIADDEPNHEFFSDPNSRVEDAI